MDSLTEKQGQSTVNGFTVYDTVLIMHMIEKLLRGGGVTGQELPYIAALRHKAIAATKESIGFDIETLNNKKPTTETVQGG